MTAKQGSPPTSPRVPKLVFDWSGTGDDSPGKSTVSAPSLTEAAPSERDRVGAKTPTDNGARTVRFGEPLPGLHIPSRHAEKSVDHAALAVYFDSLLDELKSWRGRVYEAHRKELESLRRQLQSRTITCEKCSRGGDGDADSCATPLTPLPRDRCEDWESFNGKFTINSSFASRKLRNQEPLVTSTSSPTESPGGPKSRRFSTSAIDADRRKRAIRNGRKMLGANSTKINMDEPRSSLQKLAEMVVKTTYFEAAFGALIFSNAIFMGLVAEHSALHRSSELPVSFRVTSGVYTTLFFAEFLLRAVAYGKELFGGAERWWTLLDVIVICHSLVELVLDVLTFIMSSAKSDQDNMMNLQGFRVVRVLRIIRLLRAFRIARIVRFIRALRILIFSICSTLKLVSWALILLALIIYVFALLFTQAYVSHVDGTSDDEAAKRSLSSCGQSLQETWGGMGPSMHTLFSAVTGGMDWGEAIEPFAESGMSWVWSFAFVVYICFTYFAVMNVVTGVFCQSAIESATQDHEAAVQFQLKNSCLYAERLRQLFESLGATATTMLNYDMFEEQLEHEEVKAFFASLDIEATDAWELFKLIDVDEKDVIDLHKFIQGCMRLKGNAKSIDIAKVHYENSMMRKKMAEHMQFTEYRLEELRRLIPLSVSMGARAAAEHGNNANRNCPDATNVLLETLPARWMRSDGLVLVEM